MKFTKVTLHTPSLDSLVPVLEKALLSNFKEVEVEVVDCPNLESSPWNMAAPGINGHPTIADIGGVDNLHYPENNGAVFDFKEIAKIVGHPDGFLMGPGAGYFKHTRGVNSELVANTNLGTKKNNSVFAIVKEDGDYVMDTYKANECGVLVNLMISEGKPGKVLHVKGSGRTGPLDFVKCMKKGLEQQFGTNAVGLGGVFQIKKGKIKAHVMPDFTRKDLLTATEVDKWLKFYEMKAPLTCVSVFMTVDVDNLGWRTDHTHFFSEHGDAGHYHYDTTPEEVEYEGYFVLCESAFRIEPPNIDPQRKEFFKK